MRDYTFETSCRRRSLTALAIAVLVLALASMPALATQTAPPAGMANLNLMPWPAHVTLQQGQLAVTPQFRIAVVGHPKQRLYDGATRLLHKLQRRTGISFEQHVVTRDDTDAAQATLVIRVHRPGVLKLGEDESYALKIDGHHALLTAEDGLGALHGLQTFLQLVQSGASGYYLPGVDIKDRPRFRWRGLMIDVARHFEPVNVIERNIRGMAAVKLNVLHLHLSDNQGFRVQSKVFPKLTEMGSRGQYFTQREIRHIIQYAADRGIIVIPEFDLPAHALSWLVSHPQLASAPGPYHLKIHFGGTNPPFDPTNPQTYRFLGRFFKEMSKLFPAHYIHIGGDENSGRQWNANPLIQAYMQPSITSNEALQAHFTQKLAKLINADGKQIIGWGEILQPGIEKGAVIQVWRGKKLLYKAAREGHPVILSKGYYLDLVHTAAQYYENDPIPADANLTPAVRKNILGGEAEMWGELVRPATIDSRIWPNAAAIAERLWSPRDVNDVAWMYKRLRVVNRELEDLGLTQIRNQSVLLRQLAGSHDIEPLKMLVGVISPLRGYRRMASGNYTIYSPLASIADAATPNAWTAVRFNAEVKQFAQHPDAATARKIRAQLEYWRANAPALKASIAASPALHPVQPLADSLAKLARIGLRALGYLDHGRPVPRHWARDTTTTFMRSRDPAAAVKLRIVDAVEQLVVIAIQRGQPTTDGASGQAHNGAGSPNVH